MKFVSWNVNGLRACMGKGFMDSFNALDADFFCLQETKLQEGQINMELPGYYQYWCYAQKKGYSGTAIFTRYEPQSVAYGIGIEELDTEGRVITLEYPEFYLVTCYTPNAQRGLARIEHRMKWEDAFRGYLKALDDKKPVILCGDLNVAHKEIDLKNPSSNRGNAGFSDEERGAFSALLDAGFTDSFRHLYPDVTGAYSWWSYMFNARQNNAGWRIDYFVVSNRLADAIHDATIHPDVMGSDHCPVGLDLNTTCNGGIRIAPPDIQEQPEINNADGTDSVGISRIFMALVVFVLLGALVFALLPRFKSNPDGESRPSTVAMSKTEQTPPPGISVPEGYPLIAEIIDRSEDCIWSFNPEDPYSSSLNSEYFLCGDEKFHLESGTLNNILWSYSQNYSLQIVFSESYTFDTESKPEIQTENLTFYTVYEPYIRYYYGETGNIAGCFLYGYSLSSADIVITAQFDSLSCTEYFRMSPHFDFDHLTTFQIVSTIDASDIIMRVQANSSFFLDDLVNQEPLLQELLKREDAVRTLLDYIDAEYGLDILYLLETSPFSALMTDQESEEYQNLLSGNYTKYWPTIETVYQYPKNLQQQNIMYGDRLVSYLYGSGGTWMIREPAGHTALSDLLFPTFFIRLDFTNAFPISALDALGVQYIMPDDCFAEIRHVFYYEGEQIKGIFLYGYTTSAFDLDVVTEYRYIQTVEYIHVVPNYLNMDTADLAWTVVTASPLSALSPEASWQPYYTLEDFIALPPVQELLNRGQDGISAILNLYLEDESQSGVDLLLSHPAFQRIMTDEQMEIYQWLRA